MQSSARTKAPVVPLEARLPLPSLVKTVNWPLATNGKLSLPLIVPPSHTTTEVMDILPDVFFTYTAWVEPPGVILIRHGTVARNALITVVVKSMAYPLG
jgi:hypothetical protein